MQRTRAAASAPALLLSAALIASIAACAAWMRSLSSACVVDSGTADGAADAAASGASVAEKGGGSDDGRGGAAPSGAGAAFW
eukprot:113870-Chlamydomonas_euryale.AAC.1